MILFRVDVDNAYGYKTFEKKVLNYLSLNYAFPKISSLGYLVYLKELVSDLDERGVEATFFFKAKTIPKQDLCQQILTSHAVGFHAVRTKDFQEFLEDFSKVSRALRNTVHGSSKHGSGEHEGDGGHTARYDPERCISYSRKIGLKYFSGNGENPKETATIVNSVVYFPSAFWINENYRRKQFTIDWLMDESRKRDIVVLFHPYHWNIKTQVRTDYEKILDKSDGFRTFDEAVP